jgi:hypothetical protein
MRCLLSSIGHTALFAAALTFQFSTVGSWPSELSVIAMFAGAALALFTAEKLDYSGGTNRQNVTMTFGVVSLGAVCMLLLFWGREQSARTAAAFFGIVSSMMFTVSACFVRSPRCFHFSFVELQFAKAFNFICKSR